MWKSYKSDGVRKMSGKCKEIRNRYGNFGDFGKVVHLGHEFWNYKPLG